MILLKGRLNTHLNNSSIFSQKWLSMLRRYSTNALRVYPDKVLIQLRSKASADQTHINCQLLRTI